MHVFPERALWFRPPSSYLPEHVYDLLKKKGKARATPQATLEAYLAHIRKHCGITWGHGLKKEYKFRLYIDREEKWLFFIAASKRKEDILSVTEAERDCFRRIMRSSPAPLLLIYKHPKVVRSHKMAPPQLQELTIIAQRVVPPHIDLRDRSIKHRFTQAPPTYLFGYLISPRGVYATLKEKGLARATMQATLDVYLAIIRKYTGITWGNGLKKEYVDGREAWLFFTAQSLRKEDIHAINVENRAGFRRIIGADTDPVLIIYKHPKVF
ncbi:hypothetical protein HDZ31DRAFT_36311 [Schizophyllum fasciatum]